MPEQVTIPGSTQPRPTPSIPTIYGLGIMIVILIGVVLVYWRLSSEQDLAATPMIMFEKQPQSYAPCKAGEVCRGPTIKANDPEGDSLIYKFFDPTTGRQVEEITASSGEQVTPEFTFDSPGEKQLYMVVEDGSGHTSENYPIIIPVK